jgi:polyhydroxybutyrate depolymerase
MQAMRAKPPDLGPGDHTVKLTIDGFPRRYLVHVPPGIDAGQSFPVVMMLHGMGATARWTLIETELGAKADQEGFLAVFPEGVPADSSKPARFLTNPPFWNINADRGVPARQAINDVRFLTAVFDDLPTRFRVDARRLFLTGFSNGGEMTFRLATTLAPRLAAIAPVAGLCRLEDPRLARPIPTLYLVGTNDPLVPLEGGPIPSPWGGTYRRPSVRKTLEKWTNALGCPATPVHVREEDSVQVVAVGPRKNAAVLLVYYIADLGHHWPGGKGQLAETLAGKPRAHPRANDLIWDFFQQHPLRS